MIDEIKIMQYADEMITIEEKEEVEKAIQDNPEYKKLLKAYQETGDLWFKLGAEIKSQPLPDSLKEKLKVIKSWKKAPKETKISFNFFSLFKMQYAGIAAAFAIFFAGGFYTHTMIMTKKGSQGTMQAVTKKMDIESKKLKFRSATDQNLDLSERVTNIYKYFEEEKFIDEISPLLSDLTENQEFTLSLKDNNGKIIKFVLVENFNSNNSVCKKIRFNEPLRMSNIDEGTEVTLDLCKVNENYELSSINISK
jgi:hypothetical protein